MGRQVQPTRPERDEGIGRKEHPNVRQAACKWHPAQAGNTRLTALPMRACSNPGFAFLLATRNGSIATGSPPACGAAHHGCLLPSFRLFRTNIHPIFHPIITLPPKPPAQYRFSSVTPGRTSSQAPTSWQAALGNGQAARMRLISNHASPALSPPASHPERPESSSRCQRPNFSQLTGSIDGGPRTRGNQA